MYMYVYRDVSYCADSVSLENPGANADKTGRAGRRRDREKERQL